MSPVTLGNFSSLKVAGVTTHTGVTNVYFRLSHERPGFWGVALLVAICLALLMLALNSKDFSQALQLVGQY